MATSSSDGERGEFFEVGEIRPADDLDFAYFVRLADSDEGWTKKYDSNGLVVYNRDTSAKSVKMFKVRNLILCRCAYAA